MNNRYTAAFLSFALVIVGALVTIPSGAFDVTAGIQLAILGVTAAVTLFLPLSPTRWRGLFKTGSAAVLALLQALMPLILGGVYDRVTIGLVVLAILQAISAEMGVQMRTDLSRVGVDTGFSDASLEPPAAPDADEIDPTAADA